MADDPQAPRPQRTAEIAAALRDAGDHVAREHGGRFAAVIEAAQGSALVLTDLLAAATSLSPAEIDGLLWSRGATERYKSLPRPRSRNTAY